MAKKDYGKNEHPVDKKEIVRNAEIYKEHPTEKVLVEEAANLIVLGLAQKRNAYGYVKWDGQMEVYGRLPYGDTAIGTYVADGQKIPVKAKAFYDKEKATVLIKAEADGEKFQKVLHHFELKHGYLDWKLKYPCYEEQKPVYDTRSMFSKNEIPSKDRPLKKPGDQKPIYVFCDNWY